MSVATALTRCLNLAHPIIQAFCFHLDGVRTGLQLWKVEPARVIGARGSPKPSLLIRDRHRRTRHRRAAGIAYLADDRAGSFTLPTTNIERVERSMVVRRVPFVRTVRIINLT
jgi:hypothetical protein